jgi:hypothetical protein
MSNSSADPQPQSDPYTEPANSTVDDWHGQEVDRDAQAADKAMEAADGDVAEAEKIFEETRPEHTSDQYKVPEDERPT